jgi:diguanylate cyclase (GGDEF)-like protein
MGSPRRVASWLRSARTWIVLGVLAPIGMVAVSGVMLIEMRGDAWERAEQTSRNLLQVVERDIARNVEIIDLSLQAVIDNLQAPGVAEASPELRQLILFDRAASAKDLGVMLVLDENGDSVIDAAGWPARRLNNADRAYFQAHKADPKLGLHISQPLVSRLGGNSIVVLSRRIDKPDGSFGGLVLASLSLSYFDRLFERLELGRLGAINLYRRDGTRITRYPSVASDIGANIAGTQNFELFAGVRSGRAVAISVRDGIERFYTFTQVGDLPLILNVALATQEIEAEWRVRALVIGAVVLVLCGLTIGLSLLFGRELRRRAAVEAELARLSHTDALTGLANRRRFEDALAEAFDGLRAGSEPLSLLIVDADHFKRYNDRYGHAVGDTVLRALAGALSASVHRPDDLVARVGGEEFALLLPSTDADGALRIAEKIHAEVAALAIGSAGIGAETVTVSIGLATAPHGRPADLFGRADAALYEAKATGRNRTCQAPSLGTAPASSETGDPANRPQHRHAQAV